MRFLVLGSVELQVGGGSRKLSAGKEQTLAASLALESGRPVSVGTLIGRLWPEDPPKQARQALFSHVSRLRGKLRDGDRRDDDTEIISSRQHSYVLDKGKLSVDHDDFKDLVTRARTATAGGDEEQAIELLSRARRLWRDEPLAGLDGTWPDEVRGRLTARYVDAVTAQSAAYLRLGRFTDPIPDLTDLSHRDPCDEQIAAHLMLACYGAGRFPEAMRAFQRVRAALHKGHGASPGAELSRLHQQILRGDRIGGLVGEVVRGHGRGAGAGAAPLSEAGRVPGATIAMDRRAPGPRADHATGHEVGTVEGARTPTRTASVRTGGTAPSALPPYARVIGREAELERVTSRMPEAAGEDALPIVLISGLPGVGKSAFAVHAARALAAGHPDGSLYLNLQAHMGSQSPLTPIEALGSLVRMLRGADDPVPQSQAELASLWRTLLAERRCLVVLDDARDHEQIAPLLPGSPGSTVIVTSRRMLGGVPQALTVQLKALSLQDGITMFRSIVGTERAQDLAAVARIVRLCGLLPLAIEVAAHRLHARPAWNLETLGERLERVPGRLRELHDAERDVSRVFAMSYVTLPPAEQAAFRRLTWHPGPQFALEAAAELLGLPPADAEPLLEGLQVVHLLHETTADHYKYHDLLGEFARSLAQQQDSDADREAAMDRLLLFFLGAAARADRLAYPRVLAPATAPPEPPAHLPFRPTADAARAWFQSTRSVLLDMVDYARHHGRPEAAAQLAGFLAGFLDAEGYGSDARTLATQAVTHWRAVRDSASLCRSLLSLAAAFSQVSQYGAAWSAAEEGLGLARGAGDVVAEGEALRVLGVVRWHEAAYESALDLYRAALRIKLTTNDSVDIARMYNNIGITHKYLGHFNEAIHYVGTAIGRLRVAGEVKLLGRVLSNQAAVYIDVQNKEDARRCLEEAIPLLKETGNPQEVATANANLADVLVHFGEAARSLPVFRESISVFRGLRDQKSQASCVNGLGAALLALGRHGEALNQFGDAAELAAEIGAAHEETVARIGLGRAALALGDGETACSQLHRAILLADRAQDRDEGVRARELLASTYQSMGNMPEAYSTLREALGLIGDESSTERGRIATLLAALGTKASECS
ncbi:tetratricopeptide repeat protein [Streptomyces sp. NA04227]|uniref:AfsR/SARP family transcriptional regulator n=1 Tax=Streptomyces sp. NA04227 TaxID=2742136 RepID=UPI00159276D0|nr:BTAD domain-containing putative transcriptional regulator [Streptomyces sp. NA04227]QKW07584.1 tetratricopeptide repeat protein [Streptomyces sp. NA04227]